MIRRTAEVLARTFLTRLRDRPGARTIQGTSDGIRGGNNLYLWQWAHLERAAGRRAAVQRSSTMAEWLVEFPLLDDLTVGRGEISVLDRRRFATRFFYDRDFDRAQNREFCAALLSSSEPFRTRQRRIAEQITDRTCVVNVRRGDYYEVPEFRARFGIDIRAHVDHAIEHIRGAGRPTEDVLVVSDDTEWCRSELADLLPRIRVIEDRTSMFDDLAALSSATTLVLANSTFSYWGSHLAASRIPDHLAIAPSHHERLPDGERISPMFDPRWPRTPSSTRGGGTVDAT